MKRKLRTCRLLMDKLGHVFAILAIYMKNQQQLYKKRGRKTRKRDHIEYLTYIFSKMEQIGYAVGILSWKWKCRLSFFLLLPDLHPLIRVMLNIKTKHHPAINDILCILKISKKRSTLCTQI